MDYWHKFMKTKYNCEYCDNHGSSGYDEPDACLLHESKCDYNPANKSCATCRHYDWHPDKDGDDENPFWCNLFKDQTWRTKCDKHELKTTKRKSA